MHAGGCNISCSKQVYILPRGLGGKFGENYLAENIVKRYTRRSKIINRFSIKNLSLRKFIVSILDFKTGIQLTFMVSFPF